MSSDTDLGDSSIEYLGDSSIDVSVPDNTMDYSFIIENDALVRGHAGDTDMGDSNNSSLSRCESDFNDCEDDSLIVDTDGEDTFIPSRILSSSTPVKRVHNGKITKIRIQKKLSLEVINIKECCAKACVLEPWYTTDKVRVWRQRYWEKERWRRQEWMQEQFEDSAGGEYPLDGHLVCLTAYREAIGVSRAQMYRYMNNRNRDDIRPFRRVKVGDKSATASSWFGRHCGVIGDRVPHKKQIWLPFGTRLIYMYRQYRTEVDEPCGHSTFYGMVKRYFKHVKIRKNNMFTKCRVCTKLARRRLKARTSEQRRDIDKRRQEHYRRQANERLAYYRRREMARQSPSRIYSIILDGMDQAKTAVPHFVGPRTRDLKWDDQLKVHVTGVIDHGEGEYYTFTDMKEFPQDSNMTINIILKMIEKKASKGPLPKTLYVQADNCWKENKNRYVLSFLQLLVELRIFEEVQLSFLLVGHTHEDIDQYFSTISSTLRHNDAYTIPSLHRLMKNAQSLRQCFDIVGWLSPQIANIDHHSKPCMFRFRRCGTTINMYYRKLSTQSWKVVKGGLLAGVPDGTPKMLKPDYSKEINIEQLKAKVPVWATYMSDVEAPRYTEYWNHILNRLGQFRDGILKLKEYDWPLPGIPRQPIPDDIEIVSLPAGLQNDLNRECENAEVHVRFTRVQQQAMNSAGEKTTNGGGKT